MLYFNNNYFDKISIKKPLYKKIDFFKDKYATFYSLFYILYSHD